MFIKLRHQNDVNQRPSGVFIANFEHISLFSAASIVDFERVNLCRETHLNFLNTSYYVLLLT